MNTVSNPLYLTLTDWNDAIGPSKEANNDTVYPNEAPGKDGEGNVKPAKSFQEQEYGMPLTSRNGKGKGDTRADHPEESENIDILMWILNMLGAGAGTGPKSNGERSKTIGSGTPTLHDMRDDPKIGTKEEKEAREKQELQDAERRKGANTIITVKIFVPGERYPRIKGDVTFAKYLRVDVGTHPPGTRYEITKIDAAKPEEPYFSSHEMETRISKKLSETDDQ